MGLFLAGQFANFSLTCMTDGKGHNRGYLVYSDQQYEEAKRKNEQCTTTSRAAGLFNTTWIFMLFSTHVAIRE